MILSLHDTTSNCVHLFEEASQERQQSPALWTLEDGLIGFHDLRSMTMQAQSLFRRKKIGPGDSVLVFDRLSPELYASIIAIMALGATCIFVEPWMPINQLNQVIQTMQPKLFLTGPLGMAWGIRSKSLRNIPHWVWLKRKLKQESAKDFHLEPVNPDMKAIVTFTTGTTGTPKGVVRNHQGLIHQQKTLSHLLLNDSHPETSGSDLCLFGNFALSNLVSGRLSLIVPSKWDSSFFKQLAALPQTLQPTSVTCGPAFLQKLLELPEQPLHHSLQSFHLGGALSDCDLWESGFKRWPHASWMHVYGSSEAEPVAHIDAQQAVAKSREKGFFQNLCLGNKVPSIAIDLQGDRTWVSGPYVCPYYIGNEQANREHKKVDAQGRLWHQMGDRLHLDSHLYWYQGRSHQPIEEFKLEQKLYTLLRSSRLFIHRQSNGSYIAVGEELVKSQRKIQSAFPQIERVIETKIVRDKRHRARIDRPSSLKPILKELRST